MLNSQPLQFKNGLAVLVTILLWVVLAALGVLCVLALRETALSLYVLSLESVPSFGELVSLAPQGYNQAYWRGVVLGQWGIFLLAILWIVVVIGGAEYLYHHFGKPKAWKFLGWTLGAELVVLVLRFVI